MLIRKCPICNSSKNKVIFIQKFTDNLVHEISHCLNCGFVFVKNSYSQKYYNNYYAKMSKYEFERDHELHCKYFKFITPFVTKKDFILDIGCSTGHLLSFFKKRGYSFVLGIDPSRKCSFMAKKKFGVKVKVIDLFNFYSKKKFNFIIMSMVIEHIRDVKKALAKVSSLLVDEGFLFISVPDASRFYEKIDEPFGEFSIEHINFFSSNYLFILLKEFSCIKISSDNRNIYSIWKKNDSLKKSISSYIKISNDKQKKINNFIDTLPSGIVIWGAGSFTRKILMNKKLKNKTSKIVDKDVNLQNKTIEGIKVFSPNILNLDSSPILISSFRFKNEIKNEINTMKIKNKILMFD